MSEMYNTEQLDLPSKGLLYPATNPLSKGVIELRQMTAADEDALSSPSLLKKGIALDYLFKSLIVGDINYDDLVAGDKDAIMIAVRISAYGAKYEPEIECPSCTNKQKTEVDLTQICQYKELDKSLYSNKNEFEFVLPVSNKKIKFKLLTHKDEKDIEKELKFQTEINKKSGVKDKPEKLLSTRLKYIIQSIEGVEPNKKRDFIDTMAVRDSRELRNYYTKISPGIERKFLFSCTECGREEAIDLPITVDFFWG